MKVLSTIALFFYLLSSVRAQTLRGGDIHVALHGDGSSRILQNACPSGYKVAKTFYNVLFDLYSDRDVDCSESEYGYIGRDFQKTFDMLLSSQNDGNMDEELELLESKTKVCSRYDEVKDKIYGGKRMLLSSDDEEDEVLETDKLVDDTTIVDNSFSDNDAVSDGGDFTMEVFNKNENRNEDGLQRRLAVRFRIYLYRSAGKCFFCYQDDLDRRRRSLQSQDPLDTALVQEFAKAVQDLQRVLDSQLTNKVKRFTKRSRHCLYQAAVHVKSTVTIKPREIKNACDDVYCCAHETDQEKCFFQEHVAEFCHASKERCETNCAGGVWINANDPPQCLSFHDKCTKDRNGNDECCPGSVCHKYPGESYKCVSEDNLKSGKNTSRDGTSVSIVGPGKAVAVAPVGDCKPRMHACSQDSDCCDDLKCRRNWFWHQCK